MAAVAAMSPETNGSESTMHMRAMRIERYRDVDVPCCLGSHRFRQVANCAAGGPCVPGWIRVTRTVVAVLASSVDGWE